MSRASDRLERPAGEAAKHVREAERFCQRMARREAGNFYWGFVSLPRDQRVAIYALYDFARQVDDEADAAGRPHLAASLAHHRERAHGCAAGEASDPVALVLSSAMCRYAIPESELQALIDGVQADLTCTRYATWTDLEAYCRLVASTIGRMCVRIFGFEDPAALDRADELGLALQLTNILRDVKEDGELGRVYLPGEDLERFGCSEADLAAPTAGPVVRQLMTFETDRASRLLDQGAPLVGTLRGSARLAVAGYLAGGRAALAAIRGQHYDVLRGTPRGRKPRLAAELAEAYLRGR